MKSKTTKILALTAALFGLGITTPAMALTPAGTKTISYKGSALPQWTTGDSTIYDGVYGAFNEGGKLELSFTLNWNGNNCGAYQCIFHAGAKNLGFSIYENGGPHLILSPIHGTSETYELYQDMNTGNNTIVCRFENAGEGSANVSIDLNGTCHNMGTWTFSQMSWGADAAERNKYCMGCQAPGWGDDQKLQTSTIANNTITATYTPILHKMYSNRLSGGNAVVTSGNYGAFTVPGFGYKATEYTTRTTLSNTASGDEITGTYTDVIKKPSKDTDTATHTFAGWFMIGSLPTSGSTTFLYQARSQTTTANDNGYMVAVTSGGEVKVGKTDQMSFKDGLVSTGASIEGGKWFHLAVAVTKSASARTATPVVYVNGNKVTMASGTFATNLGGNNCLGVDIGAGVSAAGIYVDQTAIDGTSLADVAANYVVAADKELTTTISQGTTFENITWQEGAFVASDRTIATITVSGAASAGEVDITFNDPTVTLKKLKLVGSRDVRLVANSALSNIASIDRTGLTGKLTYAWPVSALPMTDANIYYGAGAGSEQTHASIAITENKYLNLRGTTPFYVGTTAGDTSPAHTMTFTDATVYCKGWSGLAVGQATVTVEGSSTVSTERVILSQGRNGLTSALVVKGTASVTSTGTTDADENTNSVMFGHWNGPSTFTLQDSATFTSASQVLVGKTGNNQTINIAGGVFTAKGIKAASNATGSNAINLSGGKLVLGEVGITSYSTTTLPVNVTGNAVIEASANMTISQSITVNSGKALTFTDPVNTTTTVSGVISGAGSIVKDGAGYLVLSGANTFTGGTTINAGALVLGSDSALGLGTVTLTANGQLDLYGHSATVTIVGSGTVCNSSPTTAHINGIPVGAGKELTFTDGKTSIIVPEGETLTLAALPPNGTVTIGGAGRVAYTTSGTNPAYPTWTWIADGDDAWTGTFALTGFNGAATSWNPTTYYNGTKSRFEFNGTVSSGYFWLPNAKDNLFGELVLKDNITFNDGHTHPTGSEEKSITHYCFTKLSGSGNFTMDTSTTASPVVKFADVSDYTGTISIASSNTDGNGYRVTLGDGYLDAPTEAAIHFTGNVTLDTLTLSAKNGVKIADDASLVFDDKDSKLTVNSSVTVNSGKTIPVKIADATGLTAGTALITWTSQPSGDFSLVASGVAAGQSGFKASKNDTNLTAIADTSKTYYEVEGGETTTTFDNAWLTAAGVTGSTTEDVQKKLDTPNANGIKPSDAYLMGYEAKEAQNAAVILKPDQAQSNGETISLSVAGVPTTTRNGAVITYTALASADRNWENPSVEEEIGATRSVSMALPTSGVLYYRVQATVSLP